MPNLPWIIFSDAIFVLTTLISAIQLYIRARGVSRHARRGICMGYVLLSAAFLVLFHVLLLTKFDVSASISGVTEIILMLVIAIISNVMAYALLSFGIMHRMSK